MIMLVLATALMAFAPESRAAQGVEVPNAIVALHNAYVKCQDDKFDATRITDRSSFAAEVENAIAACSADKTELMKRADGALLRDPAHMDRAKREAAIAEAFDGYDEMRREMARR